LASERRYDHLVIESSGISEPLHVAETFSFVRGHHGSLSDIAQLDTMITVVDAQRFLSDYRAAETLVQLGRGRDAEDNRTIGKLLAEQVEFADLILVNKCDLVDEAVIDEVTGVLKALNPRAEISRMVRGAIPLAKVLGTRRFDIQRAAQSRGWMMELRGEEVPETEEYGIASTVYRARVPFHPGRFMSFLNSAWSNGRLLRSKGYFWLANEVAKIWTLSQAGGEFSYEETGRWWRFISKELWPDDYRLDHLLRDWDENVGDCRQEIVFIGQSIDFEALFSELDRCLLTTEEVRGGVSEWKNY
jgi:G3E family GTPase